MFILTLETSGCAQTTTSSPDLNLIQQIHQTISGTAADLVAEEYVMQRQSFASDAEISSNIAATFVHNSLQMGELTQEELSTLKTWWETRGLQTFRSAGF